ncbi:uncharacterized protein MONBRDRAFT_32812 [Monosiga brevicollis MX1]|uniref:Aspartate kinase n=1 Tax=Monosiga brevicollis TaxID=81824 RepID=A9V1V1_MONBE|nr:uncharacterized protein MONBRDRAFT_32812 [Monosiga brevicollis MX1]EDQ88506.1 predicted protein [Monosiga brevicollis MX1]|eukprot:XP_001746610.1 hypothetical protein [Monosiga brevicollis MX1]
MHPPLCSSSAAKPIKEWFVNQTSRALLLPASATASDAVEFDIRVTYLAACLQTHELCILNNEPGYHTLQLDDDDANANPKCRLLRTVSYEEAIELSGTTPEVIHPEALTIARTHDVKVALQSVHMAAGSRGTDIYNHAPASGHASPLQSSHANHVDLPLKALRVKHDVVLWSLSSPAMRQAAGFMEKVFSTLAKFSISVDVVTTSDSTISMTLDPLGSYADNAVLLQAAKELAKICQIQSYHPCAVISIVGDGVNGRLADIMRVLNVQPHMVSRASSGASISVVVDEVNSQQQAQMAKDLFDLVDMNADCFMDTEAPVARRQGGSTASTSTASSPSNGLQTPDSASDRPLTAPALQQALDPFAQDADSKSETTVTGAEESHNESPIDPVEVIAPKPLPLCPRDPFTPYSEDSAYPASIDARWWWAQRDVLRQKVGDVEPVYVYSRDMAFRQTQRLISNLNAVDSLFFAIKANSHPDVLRAVHAAGAGFECVSQMEIDLILSLFPDIDVRHLLFTPNFAARSEYEHALKLGVNVTVDNSFVLQEWHELFRGAKVLLRIDSGQGQGHHAHVKTGGSASKFGLDVHELAEVAQLCAAHGIEVFGLHCHSGSGVENTTLWANHLQYLAKLAREHFPAARVINVGGGLSIPYTFGGAEVNLKAVDDALAAAKAEFPQFQVWMEPGRFIAAQCGIVLAKVTQIKHKSGVKFVGVTAGMHTMIRPALYQAYHEVVNISRDGPPANAVVCGPICESGDVFARERPLPEDTREGDVLLIDCCGAYGFCMASTYNLRPLPEELIV